MEEKLKTFFAPAERAEQVSVVENYNLFAGFKQVNEIINALPYIAAVLNEQRQVVYGNKPLLQAMGYNNIDEVLGLRPGEVVKCVHSTEQAGGCGTSESCRFCGAVNAIIECFELEQKVVKECRIIANQDGKEVSFDFEVTASPFIYGGQRFVVLSLSDISNEKRRQVLERLFFHDIINTAGGLRGFIEILEITEDPLQSKEYVKIASRLSDMLIEEILAQRQLLAAERGELKINKQPIDINTVMTDVKQQVEHHQVSSKKTITIRHSENALQITTDAVLLKRVLLNMLKNAIEASREGQKVILWAEKNEDNIRFHVKNEIVIPREIQLQIFQRSFSTKGSSRGIGTYSIKLFAEQYLGGKVTFVSNEAERTIFSVELPV